MINNKNKAINPAKKKNISPYINKYRVMIIFIMNKIIKSS